MTVSLTEEALTERIRCEHAIQLIEKSAVLKQSFQLEPRLYDVLREVNAILMVEHRASKQQLALEQELWQRCAPYANTALPLHTLCEQVECFLFPNCSS